MEKVKFDSEWRTFVLHVKKGYEERATHISCMMKRMKIPFEYILDGDIQDINADILDKYFTGNMASPTPATSCALKHIIACKNIVDMDLEGALVLEDDIVLHNNFMEVFRKSINELNDNYSWNTKPVIINYEDTRLRFIPRSKRIKGRVLYEGDRDRMTGALYVNRLAAELILDYALRRKLDRPIDLFHCKLIKDKSILYLWCQPVIATQGSHTGMFKSGINLNKKSIDE